MQAILHKHDILFVVDEVITGFGRTGEWFGSDLYGLKPDLMSVAKGLSSAYQPIGAVLLSDRVYDTLADGSRATGYFANGFTNGGHPVAAAVALEAIGSTKSADPRACTLGGRRFMDRLAGLERKHEMSATPAASG